VAEWLHICASSTWAWHGHMAMPWPWPGFLQQLQPPQHQDDDKATRGSRLDVPRDPWQLAGPVQFWTRWRHVTVTSSTLIDHILEALKNRFRVELFQRQECGLIRGTLFVFLEKPISIQMDLGKVDNLLHTNLIFWSSCFIHFIQPFRCFQGEDWWWGWVLSTSEPPKKLPWTTAEICRQIRHQIGSGADCSRPCPCILAGSKSGIRDPMEAADVGWSSTDMGPMGPRSCLASTGQCPAGDSCKRPEILEIDVGRCAMVVARKGRSGQWEVLKLFRCI
jgi:hypothetical protein